MVAVTAASPATGGAFSFGVEAGAPLTEFFQDTMRGTLIENSTTHRYVIGGKAELRLPAGFGLEFDVLFRHFEYNAAIEVIDSLPHRVMPRLVTGYELQRTTGNAWEFPILAKYRFAKPFLKPYIDGGVAFDTLSALNQTFDTIVNPNSPEQLKNRTTAGFVVGLGAEIHARLVHITPEIRYTHWRSPHFAAFGLSWSNQNQA